MRQWKRLLLPRSSIITGTGSYLPERVLTNRDLEAMVDTTDEWIIERTGIKERRIAAENQTTSDLACEASKAVLRSSGREAQDLDLIIVATTSPDMLMPSTACMLQAKLGASRAAAFDVSAACSGFVYALSVANAMIRSGSHKRVLVVGAELLSRFMDWQDRTTCVLFGDGAGAVLLEASEDENRGIMSVKLHADGNLWDLLHIPGGGATTPMSHGVIEDRLNFIKMKGSETFKVAVRALESLVVDSLKENGLNASDIALLIPHQANIRIILATASRLGLPMDRVMINLERVGNTSAASIPIALDEAMKQGRIKENDYVLLEAFGAGLTWASALVKW